jgi:hypothetical protein
MTLRFLSIARRELDDAVAWYDGQAEGIGMEFLDEMDRVLRRIVAYPLSGMVLEPGLRRCILTRFPYGIIYGIEGSSIIVLAVAHLHRRPRYWKDRTIQ